MPNWFVSSWGSHLWDKPRIGHLPNRSTYLCGSKWDDLEAGAAFFFVRLVSSDATNFQKVRESGPRRSGSERGC